tara:strand:- start:1914 stop:3056 length:1143 start_codon:yes stop_codon:yes gene_type:complete
MRYFWLLFSQTVTVALAIWFIIATLKPEWVNQKQSNLTIQSNIIPLKEVESSKNFQHSYREASKRAMPAVVNIFTDRSKRSNHPFYNDPFFRRFFGDQLNKNKKKSNLGSGVIVSSEGYILTNNHVIEAAEKIEVALADGRKVSAKLVGTDPETDLAVIKISLNNLPSITLGRLDNTKVGDVVLAIGNPFGVGQTVTMGIVSGLGRNRLGINTFENFIQTDAAINPGNSGGALVDFNGNLLGINTAIYSRSGGSLGIGFAIPISTVKLVLESIIKNGQVVRGWIGVEPQDITREIAQHFGLKKTSGTIIAGVLRGGPAEKAGIKPGDILLTVANQPINDTVTMLNLISKLKPGKNIEITVLRDSNITSLNLTVGKRPKIK